MKDWNKEKFEKTHEAETIKRYNDCINSMKEELNQREELIKKLDRFLDNSNAEIIVDLQRDLSYAEQIACAISYMVRHRDEKDCCKGVPVLENVKKTRYNGIFYCAWDDVNTKMQEFDALKEEVEMLREQLKIIRENGETESLPQNG